MIRYDFHIKTMIGSSLRHLFCRYSCLIYVTRSLVLYVSFVDRCLSFCPWVFNNEKNAYSKVSVKRHLAWAVLFTFANKSYIWASLSFWCRYSCLIYVTRSLVLYVSFVDRCLSFCPFFSFWPLCCLSCFDLRILITPLVSSNSFLIVSR
jgi:hypothetical protein